MAWGRQECEWVRELKANGIKPSSVLHRPVLIMGYKLHKMIKSAFSTHVQVGPVDCNYTGYMYKECVFKNIFYKPELKHYMHNYLKYEKLDMKWILMNLCQNRSFCIKTL